MNDFRRAADVQRITADENIQTDQSLRSDAKETHLSLNQSSISVTVTSEHQPKKALHLAITRAVVKSTFVESKTSPSPKRFESESSPSPKRFESESSPSPKRFESKSKSKSK